MRKNLDFLYNKYPAITRELAIPRRLYCLMDTMVEISNKSKIIKTTEIRRKIKWQHQIYFAKSLNVAYCQNTD